MEVQCIAYYPGTLATSEGNSIRRMMHHAVPLNNFVTVLYIPPISLPMGTLGFVNPAVSLYPPSTSSSSVSSLSMIPSSSVNTFRSRYQGIYTPQSFPPTPSSRKAVILRGYSYTEDLLYRVRDELRSLGIQQQQQQQQQRKEENEDTLLPDHPSSSSAYKQSIINRYSSARTIDTNTNGTSNDVNTEDNLNDNDTAQTPRTDYYARTPSLPSHSRQINTFASVSSSRTRSRSDHSSHNPTTTSTVTTTTTSTTTSTKSGSMHTPNDHREHSINNHSTKKHHSSSKYTDHPSNNPFNAPKKFTEQTINHTMVVADAHTVPVTNSITTATTNSITDTATTTHNNDDDNNINSNEPSHAYSDQPEQQQPLHPEISNDSASAAITNDTNVLQEYFNFFALALSNMTPSQLEQFSRQLGLENNDTTVENHDPSTIPSNPTDIPSNVSAFVPLSSLEFSSLPSLNDDNQSYSSYLNHHHSQQQPQSRSGYAKSVASRNSSELVFSFHNIHNRNHDNTSQDNQSRRTDYDYDDDDGDYDDEDSITTGSQSLSTPVIKLRNDKQISSLSSSSSTVSSVRTRTKPGLYFHGPHGSVVRVAGPAGLTGFTPARAQEIIDKLIKKQNHSHHLYPNHPHPHHHYSESNRNGTINTTTHTSNNSATKDNQSVTTSEASVPVRLHLSTTQAKIDAVAAYSKARYDDGRQSDEELSNLNDIDNDDEVDNDNLSNHHDDYDAIDQDQSDVFYSSSFSSTPSSLLADGNNDDDNLSAYWYSGTGSQSNYRRSLSSSNNNMNNNSSNRDHYYNQESKRRSLPNTERKHRHRQPHRNSHYASNNSVPNPLDTSVRPVTGDNMSLPSNAIVNSAPSPTVEDNAWPAEDAPPPPLSPRTAYSAAIAEAQAAADEAEQRKRQEEEMNTGGGGPRVFTQTHLFKHSFLYPRTREAKVETVPTEETEDDSSHNSSTPKTTRNNTTGNTGTVANTVRFLLPTVPETPPTVTDYALSSAATIPLVNDQRSTTNDNDNNHHHHRSNTDTAYETKTPFAGAEVYAALRRNIMTATISTTNTTNTTEEEKKELTYDTIDPSIETNILSMVRQKQPSPDTVDPQWTVEATLSTVTPLGPDGIFVPASTTVSSGGIPRVHSNQVRSISTIPADYLLRSSTNSKTDPNAKYVKSNNGTSKTNQRDVMIQQPTPNAPPLRALARMAVFPIEHVHNDLLICCGGHGILYPSKEATKNDPFAEYELKLHEEHLGYAFYGGGKRRGHWNWSLSTPQGTMGSVPGSVTGLGIACNRSGYRSARGGLAIPHYRPRDRTLCYFEYSIEAEEGGPFSSVYREKYLAANPSAPPNPVFICVGLAARSVPLEGPLGTLPLSVSLASSGHVVCGGQWTLLQSGTSFPSSYYHKKTNNHGFISSYTIGDTVGVLVRWLGTGGPWAPEVLPLNYDPTTTILSSPTNASTAATMINSPTNNSSNSNGTSGTMNPNPPFDALQLTFSVNGRVVGVSGVISVPRGTELYPTIALGTPGVRIIGGFSAADVKHGQRQTMVIAQAEPGTLPLHYNHTYFTTTSNDPSSVSVTSPSSPSANSIPSYSHHLDHQAYGSLASSTYLAGTSGYAVFALDGSMLLPHTDNSSLSF